jgi:hypothetical protein
MALYDRASVVQYRNVGQRGQAVAAFNADILASVHLFAQVGRSMPIRGDIYKCPFFYQDEAFDCCLDLAGTGPMELGQTLAKIPIAFLCPELIKPRLKAGDLFHLWEGKIIGYGLVEEVLPDLPMEPVDADAIWEEWLSESRMTQNANIITSE